MTAVTVPVRSLTVQDKAGVRKPLCKVWKGAAALPPPPLSLLETTSLFGKLTAQ